MKWLGIVGSLRRASNNRGLLRALAAELPEGVSLSLYDGLGELPPFNADVPYNPPPAPVQAMNAAMAAADGLIFATPEYNYSVPGVLKNAIDWATRPPQTSPLRRKPIGLLGAAAGMSGTIRAQHHLRQILVYTDSMVMNAPEVLVARSHERFDADGNLHDETTRHMLRRFAEAFEQWVKLHHTAG